MKSLIIFELVFIKIILFMIEDSKGSMYLSFWFFSFSCMILLVVLVSFFYVVFLVCVLNVEGGSRLILLWFVYIFKIYIYFVYIFRYV